MTLKDEILATILASPGITDASICETHPGGPSRHQQINQRCRLLVDERLIVREKRGHPFIGNYPVEGGTHHPSTAALSSPRPHPKSAPDAAQSAPTQNAVAPTSTMSVSLRWHSAGELAFDPQNRLQFPTLAPLPGIYRLRFTRQRAVYIGPSKNLKKRMGNYRVGHQGQKTSAWVNRALHAALDQRELVLIDTSTDVSLNLNGQSLHADLSFEPTRLFVENAALLCEGNNGWTLLNKAAS